MVPRQVWLFGVGCWTALITAVLHVAAHVASPGTGTVAGTLVDGLRPTHVWTVPGLRQPTFTSVIDAFSLMVAVLLATIGAAGLAVLKSASDDFVTARTVSRVFAIGTAATLLTSVALAFSIETFFLAVVALCFGLCSVAPEAHEHGPEDPRAREFLLGPTSDD